jgi:hypothetical protein
LAKGALSKPERSKKPSSPFNWEQYWLRQDLNDGLENEKWINAAFAPSFLFAVHHFELRQQHGRRQTH